MHSIAISTAFRAELISESPCNLQMENKKWVIKPIINIGKDNAEK